MVVDNCKGLDTVDVDTESSGRPWERRWVSSMQPPMKSGNNAISRRLHSSCPRPEFAQPLDSTQPLTQLSLTITNFQLQGNPQTLAISEWRIVPL